MLMQSLPILHASRVCRSSSGQVVAGICPGEAPDHGGGRIKGKMLFYTLKTGRRERNPGFSKRRDKLAPFFSEQ